MVKKTGQHLPSQILRAIKRHNGVFVILLFAIVIITVFLFADRGFLHFYESYNEREALQGEIKELEQKKEQLLQEKDKLQNDPEQIEKIAREKYKMKKKEEKVYQVEMEKDE
jgi:cell division protein DivIC